MVVNDLDLYSAVRRSNGKICAVPVARLASRLDGRTNTHFRVNPRGDHGHSRDIHGCAHVSFVRDVHYGVILRANHWRNHGVLYGAAWARAE